MRPVLFVSKIQNGEVKNKIRMEDVYGLHLMLRLNQIQEAAALDDRDLVSSFLVDLVGRLGMRVLAGPLVGEEGGTPEKAGKSGVVILYESHAAIHTYPSLQEAFIDVFSCRPFDVDRVRGIFYEYFGVHAVVEQVTHTRGIHWTNQIEREAERWRMAR